MNPYQNDLAALMYVTEDKSKAIVFNYLVNNRVSFHTNIEPVRLDGLDRNKKYRVKEINLYPGSTTRLASEQLYSGDFLMKIGINPNLSLRKTSAVLEVTEVKE
jgi:alpha-galactosidase